MLLENGKINCIKLLQHLHVIDDMEIYYMIATKLE